MADGFTVNGINENQGGNAISLEAMKKRYEETLEKAGNMVNGFSADQLPGILCGKYATTASNE